MQSASTEPGQASQGLENPATMTFQASHEPSSLRGAPCTGRESDFVGEKRPAACKGCRHLKVRCTYNDAVKACKRCLKARRKCEPFVPSKRKCRTKTGSRVAALEEKIDALTSALRSGADTSPPADSSLPNSDGARAPRKYGSSARPLRRPDHAANCQSPTVTYGSFPSNGHHEHAYVDIIDRVIDIEVARELLLRYQQEMFPYTPVVPLGLGTSLDCIRTSKPLLLLSIFVTASSTPYPVLHRALMHELKSELANQIFITAKKSLELVQALLVLTTFYEPPQCQDMTSMSILVHNLAAMALDIGIGRKSKSGDQSNTQSLAEFEESDVEARRTWLGCYHNCIHSTIALRRPVLIPWSSYIEESIDILSSSPYALSSDKYLIHLIEIDRITEDTAALFRMDDPSQSRSLTSMTIQYHVRGCEGLLQTWLNHALMSDWNIPKALMQFLEAVTNLYVHELAMHNAHNVDDYKLQTFRQIRAQATFEDRGPDQITPVHVEALRIYLRSIHNAFDAFLSLDPQILHAVPGYFIVRNNYPAVALVKLYGAIISNGSILREHIELSNLRLAYYLDAMIGRLTEIAEGDRSPTASRICSFFLVLRSWYEKITSSDGAPCFGSVSHHPSDIAIKRTASGFGSGKNSGEIATVAAPMDVTIDNDTFETFDGLNFTDAIFTAEELDAMNGFMDMGIPTWNVSMAAP